MNVYAVTVDYLLLEHSSFLPAEGPIYVSANTYTEVESKFLASPRYGKRKIADIKLLGKLDNLQ